jgi:hypothetical protein
LRNDPVVTLPTFARRTPLLVSLATAVALAMTVGGAVPARAAAPKADFEQHIARADEHASAGRHAEALASYVEAFTAMPKELRASSVGQFVALAAANAAMEDFRARGDARSLDQGHDVLRAFVLVAEATDREGTAELVAETHARLAELDALRASASPTSEPDFGASRSDDLAEDDSDSPSDDLAPTSDRAAPDRSRLGLALAVSGGVVVLGGVGMMIAGARQVPWYEDQLASEGWLPTDPGYDAQLAEAHRVRRVDYGIGAVLLVVGVGVGVTGAVLVAKSKQRERELTLVPVLGRDRAMLAATMRF